MSGRPSASRAPAFAPPASAADGHHAAGDAPAAPDVADVRAPHAAVVPAAVMPAPDTPAVPPRPVYAQAVLDALPITVWTFDLDGRVTSINRSWARFAVDNGAPALADAAVVHGTSVWDAVASDPASRLQLERAMALLTSGQAPVVRWEFPCSSPDEERVFLMQLTALRANATDGPPADGRYAAGPADAATDPTPMVDGPVTGFACSTVDITPSHRSREALIDTGLALSRTLDLERVYREVAQQVRRAVRGAAFCLALADEDTAALRTAYQFGYVADHDPDARDALARVEQRLLPTWLDALANERVVVRPAEHGLELTAPVSSPEGVLGAMTVHVDDANVPERLDEASRVLGTLAAQTAAAVERAWLVRRVEQKRRLEAIGEVAAGVAHELRNPLFGISSAAQLLRFRVQGDAVVDKNVGRILREVERLNRMVTALLEYGRPNAVCLAPADPDLVWDDVLEGERTRLAAKRLTLVRHRAPHPADARAWRIDAEQLAQVFLNVLVNATDAAPEGSTITLASHLLPAGGWRCRLHNGGPPVPPEVAARVFELFYSTKAGGTGIGLALCQRIVDEHGGTITLESAPEAGTAVTITLPAG
jgi:signal transduction histidine kinase